MTEDTHDHMTVTVERLGGIHSDQFTFDSGVTVLTGRNATNRTSLLRAIGAGLGGSSGELKSDAEDGSVTLSVDGDTYAREFERDGDSVRVGGQPYADDWTLIDQYATLLADNPARRAVERGNSDALREFIMAPVDTDDVRATIERTQQAVTTLEQDIETAKRERERIPELEQRLDSQRERRAEMQSELGSIRESVADFEADADEAEAAETVVEELQTVRKEFERVSNQRQIQRKALESLRTERAETEATLEEVSGPNTDTNQLEVDLERLQRRERELMNSINNLLSIVEFNEQFSEGGALPTGGETDSATDRLSPETETVECWTCGTAVERQQIDSQLDSLRDVIQEKRRERNNVQTKIEDVRGELHAARTTLDRQARLEAKLDDTDSEITERETRIEDLETKAVDLQNRIEALEADVAESDELRDNDVLDRYQRLSELEYERGQLEEQIASLESELEGVRASADSISRLEERLEHRRGELTAARNRIETLEQSAVETFNEHMETLRSMLGYENVERVWIERKVDSSSGVAAQSSFDLHVVRATDDGAVYEDTIDHLSESERAVIGFVVALAGYLVHDVHETVPVMLLDSLEAIDADRIAALVEYFAAFVPFLVVALLPEDAAALDDGYDSIQMGQAPA